jgi:hypothetical protein
MGISSDMSNNAFNWNEWVSKKKEALQQHQGRNLSNDVKKDIYETYLEDVSDALKLVQSKNEDINKHNEEKPEGEKLILIPVEHLIVFKTQLSNALKKVNKELETIKPRHGGGKRRKSKRKSSKKSKRHKSSKRKSKRRKSKRRR